MQGGYYRHIDIEINIDPNEVRIAKTNSDCTQGGCSLGTFDQEYNNYRHRLQNHVSERDYIQTVGQFNAISAECDMIPAVLTLLGIGLIFFGISSVFFMRRSYDWQTGEYSGSDGWYIALPIGFISGFALNIAARYFARKKVRARSDDMKGVARRANANLERLTPSGSRTGAWVVHYKDYKYTQPQVTLGFWVPPADGSGLPPPAYDDAAIVPPAAAVASAARYIPAREGAPSAPPIQQASSIPRFCAGCGRQRKGEDLFCSGCGKRYG